MKRSFVLVLLILAVAVALLGGCASVGVEVWDRDVLARSDMQFDHQAVDHGLDEHIYFSKEASSGGSGTGGGGCGCN